MVRKARRSVPTDNSNFSVFAIAYVRGRASQNFRGATGSEQLRQIGNYAHEHGYEVVDTVYEWDGVDNWGLRHAIKLSYDHDADLIYVDMGNWNKNQIVNQLLTHLHDDKYFKNKINRIKRRILPCSVDADQRTLEAVDREGRAEKISAAKSRQNTTMQSYDPQQAWRLKNKQIGVRRLNNFQHLTNGVMSIHIVLDRNPKMSHVKMAQHLNDYSYFTVDGKSWSPDNVRKVRKEILKLDFQEFAKTRRPYKIKQGFTFDDDW